MRLEGQHPCARQESGVELEGRILGRRADEDDGAVLHDRQEGILLGAVEAMDLVDEKQRAPAVGATQPRRLEHLLQIGDAGKDRRDLLEGVIHLMGEQPRHGGLAGARRAPEDHRTEARRLEHARQDPALARQMFLADDLAELARPQPVGQRPGAVVPLVHRRCGWPRPLVRSATTVAEEIRHVSAPAAPGGVRSGRSRSSSRDCCRWLQPPVPSWSSPARR